jgi:SAM-dependent methyltransferase
MRITYRNRVIREYWQKRWEKIPVDEPQENPQTYPLKYAELTVKGRKGRILEAGCGGGRILRFYQDRGYSIVGMDYIRLPLAKLRACDAGLHLCCGDICATSFKSGSFRAILAFGLYHNLDLPAMKRALRETWRVLAPGGRLCASFRADNFHNWLIDRNAPTGGNGTSRQKGKIFHKINLSQNEVQRILEETGFSLEHSFFAGNMPILYKFRKFRAAGHKTFDESKGRREGYRLNPMGNLIQQSLMRLVPGQVGNVIVAICRRPG